MYWRYFMKNKAIGLDYKDENGEIRYELKNSIHNLERIDGFSAEEFFSNLDKIVKELSPNESFEIIKMYPKIGPDHLFGVLYYNLKNMDKNNRLEKEFDYLKEFIDYEISLYMIVNFLR